ncbi:hypothetical protein C8R47DRAFT_1092205 [Mycena vitilis]|nr:hypothetical protein C8R47DRAFT_1092205 [Mycena vitilis]
MRHPRRVFCFAQPIPLHSQTVLVYGTKFHAGRLITQAFAALSLHRPAFSRSLRQSRFVQSFMKKEGLVHRRKQVTAHVHVLRHHKAKSLPPPRCVPSDPPSPRVPIFARRSVSLQSPLSYREPSSPLSIKTPLPNLIPPSRFASPFTPANQVLHAPFHPPELHKDTPSKRHRNRNWQWSPVLVPGIDENSPPSHYPDSPDSAVCDLTKRFSLIALPASSRHVPRRLSYPQACASPCTPDPRPVQALASPVLIRSSLWPSSPVTSPRHQLDDLQFSPFHVIF